ncbi:GNAT family N-acetyltransferase [Jiangella aurantiaca]|uniref:GNAT family N-acetyltransferase n=1 Tax=Jiangella aurantiaca TaxID=2530373 RepID=A0A4R5AGH3_9ACTN|nr:GNAT family N-acetyltransferase [Jiangella aurantiaca]TDD70735.1 GNAT family N-acetyltransferase [Jiangella aurantiaca]
MTDWDPRRPADDTIVRQAYLATASWPVEIAKRAGRPWHDGEQWAGAWLGDHGTLTNPIVLVRPLEEPAKLIEELDRFFPAGVPFVVVSPWPTTDLAPFGLSLLGHFPLMARFPAPEREGRQTGVIVREVTGTDQLLAAERLFATAYPEPDLLPTLHDADSRTTVMKEPLRVWLAYLDDEPVAVAAAHIAAGVQLVLDVATLPEARGHGAGTAVSWAATRGEPDMPAVLGASDAGRPIYEGMGYLAITRWASWLRPGSPSGV